MTTYLRMALADLFMIASTALLFAPAMIIAAFDRLQGRARAWVLVRWWCRTIFRICGVELEVRGAEQIDFSRPYVIMANHRSHLDGPAIILALPEPVGFVVKRSLTRIPGWGWAIRSMYFVPVDRGNPHRARASMAAARDALARGRNMLVFPEGTRSPDGRMLPFKKGGVILALETGADILPVTVVGTRNLLPKGSLVIKPGRVRVVLHRPISVAGRDLSERNEILEEVRRAIASVDSETV